MSKTSIEWTATVLPNGDFLPGYTFNPWHGCAKVSQGCRNCYAERFSNRFGGELWGPLAGRKMQTDAYWEKPLAWNRRAERLGVQLKVFAGSMCDVFENRPALEAPRRRLFDLIEQTPWLTWMLLTKRPEGMLHLVPEEWQPGRGGRCLPNLWYGVSAENQFRLEIRWLIFSHPLKALRPPVAFLSLEPLLGEVDLHLARSKMAIRDFPDWVIVGGESGPGARPLALSWIEKIIEQCRELDIPVFVKQLGTDWARRNGTRNFKGGEPAEWPDNLRVRQFPSIAQRQRDRDGVQRI